MRHAALERLVGDFLEELAMSWAVCAVCTAGGGVRASPQNAVDRDR